MPAVSEYRGFIFDYGGVLVHDQSEEDQARMAELAGIPVEDFTELYWADRAEYDKAQLSADEYWHALARKAGKFLNDGIIAELTELDNQSWMRFDSVMWEWLDQLHGAGKRIAMLSNMPRDLGEALKSRTDRLQIFDYVTLSYEVRAIKPEPAIYEHCLEGLATEPQETLFLDDRIANVQGAELLGIPGVHFTSRDEVLLRLGAPLDALRDSLQRSESASQ
ncbi:MAG: HAD family phosphatase [Acidobacteriaceae bacterium]|nr:HAD family phosphatase [Acidobacteriaceae bacterium]